MPDNLTYFSTLCPVKFNRQGATLAARYNHRQFDEFPYQSTVPEFYAQKNWHQPWLTADTITIQLLSNYAPFSLELYTCTGVLTDTIAVPYVASSIEPSGLKVYQVSVPLSGYAVGSYYFLLKCGSPILDTFQSEAFTINTALPASLLLEYSHDENDFDAVFENDLVFSMRIPGGLVEFEPGSDRTVFIDQPRNIVQLSGRSFMLEKLIVGDTYGVPNWLAQRVNEAFLCSYVLVDGRKYVAADGAKMEATREETYPLVGWSLDVRQAEARQSKRYAAPSGENPSSVVYNIENTGFGDITTETGDTLQITNVD